jgi:mono/diheme cytochrome c family protein
VKVLKWLGVVLVVLVGAGYLGFQNMRSKAYEVLAKTWDIDVKDVPIPWPLSEDEGQDLSPQESKRIATERAIARGEKLVNTRLFCFECHGQDFGGGTVIDNPMVATWVSPNITTGGVIQGWSGKDWVRIMRHGVAKDGSTSSMPSVDYTWLSDQEISDVAAYISSRPAVDRVMPKSSFGPIYSMLYATGKIKPSAYTIDHAAPRRALPPAEALNVEFGKHLTQVCVGCHHTTFSGGKRPEHDPNWPVVSNLTPHASGLEGWTKEDWFRVFREGKSKDGRDLSPVMPWKLQQAMSDVELEAMWLYISTLPPKELGSES